MEYLLPAGRVRSWEQSKEQNRHHACPPGADIQPLIQVAYLEGSHQSKGTRLCGEPGGSRAPGSEDSPVREEVLQSREPSPLILELSLLGSETLDAHEML